jgi:8-oxo-dGTP pyrophosphatase MutT (NUDIX family)
VTNKPKPLRRVVRVFILKGKRKEVLLARQADRGQWHFTGGNVKEDEEPITAARREAKQETGLFCDRLRYIHTEYLSHENENEEIWCYRGYPKSFRGMRPDGKEIDQLQWCSLHTVKNLHLTDTTSLLLQNITIISQFV